jgi:hypothetical protein
LRDPATTLCSGQAARATSIPVGSPSCCTQTEAKEEIQKIALQLTEFEKAAAKDVDPRPWASNDNPLAVEHWGLVQTRIALKEVLKKPPFSPERRKAASEPLAAPRKTRQKPASGAVCLMQTAI